MSQAGTTNPPQLHSNLPACGAKTSEYCSILQPIELASCAKSVFNGTRKR
jgi:hypothetical protein